MQSAVDDAVNGDTVFVYDDSSPYIENITVDKSIKLVGENSDTTVIDGNRSENVVVVTADGIYINGFTIQNSGNLGFAGIDIRANNTTITGNKIFNNNDGIYLRLSTFNTITSNTIISNRGDGIEFWACHFNNITYNTINSNKNNGILCKSSDNNNIFGNYITSTKFLNGIYLSLSSSNTISDNNISNNQKNGVYQWCSNHNTISGNNILNNNNSGIFIQGHHNSIVNNTINSNTQHGIILSYYSQSPISNEIPSRFNKIKGNNISNNINGIRIVGAKHLYRHLFFRYSFNNIIKNNFMNNDRDAFFENSILNRWRQNYWNESRILPKLIFGFVTIPLLGDIPWFNVDWNPAQEPYDIGV